MKRFSFSAQTSLTSVTVVPKNTDPNTNKVTKASDNDSMVPSDSSQILPRHSRGHSKREQMKLQLIEEQVKTEEVKQKNKERQIRRKLIQRQKKLQAQLEYIKFPTIMVYIYIYILASFFFILLTLSPSVNIR